MASSYQVNLAIEIPIITENYMHVFTCRNWVSAMLRHVVGEFFMIGQNIVSIQEGLELIGTYLEN